MLLAVLSGSAYLAFFWRQPPSRTIKVTVERGQNTAQIAAKLARAGVISNAYTFRVYAGVTQTEARLQPGHYRFKTGLTYYQILKELTKARAVKLVSVVIPEGFTAKQIAERLSAKTKRPPADFYEYISGQGVPQVRPSELPPELNTVEGYLFPKTYQFAQRAHPRAIISRMIDQFQLETASVDWTFAQQKNLTHHQIVTVASLIEREAKVPEERPLMAAVIYNRLAKGMPLQIDATVQYLLPRQKAALTEQDLKIASPYNTYQQTGLPPGPIASPGIDSIKAALAPAPVDYIYYVLTSPDGHHTFTNNYNEFLAAKRRANQGQ
ncbi:MAG: endolytic transglycosylase MltG [Actinomycetota bacterium]|nr:endolytic transglycosylase MltG [Actinomycetota bacterium]